MNAQAPTHEAQLLQAGNNLVDPPSFVDELLSLLDRVESFFYQEWNNLLPNQYGAHFIHQLRRWLLTNFLDMQMLM